MVSHLIVLYGDGLRIACLLGPRPV